MKKGKGLIRLLSVGEDLLVLLFCMCLLLAGGYGLADTYLVYQQANDDSILKYRPGYEGEAPEKEISGRMTAWLTLEGTGIDQPVMQGDSNFEYLNKNPYGEFSLSGSVFLDCRNSPDYSDEYILVYGHHMENGGMFGDLDLYRKKSFFDQHRQGTLIVNGEERTITVKAVLDVLAVDEVIFSPENRTKKEILEKISQSAVQERSADGEHLIAFSTCRYPNTADRTVVIGVFSDTEEVSDS